MKLLSIKNMARKVLLKFPYFYTKIHRIHKRLLGINLNEEGVAKEGLKFLLKHMGEKRVVMEIGAFGGQTTRRLAERGNFVIAIDPYLPNSEDGLLNGEYPSEVYLRFMKNTIGKNVILFPLTSEQTFNLWDKFIKKKIINSIFIDGLHTYDGVKTDFKWIKYLKKNGIIAFDDTDLPGVKEFINEVIKNSGYKFLEGCGGIKIFQKIK